jgi:hypothetical protein
MYVRTNESITKGNQENGSIIPQHGRGDSLQAAHEQASRVDLGGA